MITCSKAALFVRYATTYHTPCNEGLHKWNFEGCYIFRISKKVGVRGKQGNAAIWLWKSRLLRSVNQDSARVEILEKLDESSILLVQGWAMKYLPRKYRESQTDWVLKRGIPRHVTKATRCEGEEIMMLCRHISSLQPGQLCCTRTYDRHSAAAEDHNPSVRVLLLSQRQGRLLPLRSNHSQCQSRWGAIWYHHKAP